MKLKITPSCSTCGSRYARHATTSTCRPTAIISCAWPALQGTSDRLRRRCMRGASAGLRSRLWRLRAGFAVSYLGVGLEVAVL